MEKVVEGLAAGLVALIGLAFLVFVGAIFGTALGALAGMIVGWVFPGSMALLAEALGIAAAPYQLGAIFGFVGGFLKTSISVKEK